jgi:hypothetical protein
MAVAVTSPNVTTIADVEIVQTGIEYPLSTGPATFTVDDLSDLVESQDDPAIKAPRLKLGHEANMGLLEDGQPAIGTVQNLRLEQDGHLVVGDYVGVPTWLAEVLPSAYPARSIEGAVGVETNTGHHWRLVLTDLALLGVCWPGVGTLDDIAALYSADGPDNIRVLTTKEEVEGVARVARGVKAQVDTEIVRRSYYEGLGQDQFWWWVRSMLVDPDELIVEDEEDGSLYRVPFSTSGDKVTFGDPVSVKVVYKDKPANQQPDKAAAVAWEVPAPPRGRPLVVYANRAESRPEQEEQVAVRSDVDPVALRTSLGLADDASDDEVRTALASAGVITPPGQENAADEGNRAPAAEQPGTSAPTGPQEPDITAPTGPTDPATAQPVRQPGAEAEAGAVEPVLASDGTVRLDREAYNRLVAGAQRGHDARTHQETEERDRVISAAIADGKVPPSRREHWVKAWKSDTDGTRTLLAASQDAGGLAPGLVPVAEAGNSSPTEDTSVEAYPAEWLPEIKRGGE